MPITTQNDTGYKAYTATAVAIAANVRVKVDSNGLISVAAAAEAAIGVTIAPIAASGTGTVKMFSAPGTYLCQASVAITKGTQVFPAASGKVAATGTTALPLMALDAAAADGDVIELAPVQKGA